MSTSQADGDPLIQELEALLDDGLVSDQTLLALHAPPVSPAALAGLMPRYQLRDLVGAGGMGFFNSGLHDPRALDPSAQLDRQFKLEILQTAIDKFHADATASEWETFSLCRLKGLNSAAAAERLSTTPEAERKRLERASAKLRRAMADLVGVEDDEGF